MKKILLLPLFVCLVPNICSIAMAEDKPHFILLEAVKDVLNKNNYPLDNEIFVKDLRQEMSKGTRQNVLWLDALIDLCLKQTSETVCRSFTQSVVQKHNELVNERNLTREIFDRYNKNTVFVPAEYTIFLETYKKAALAVQYVASDEWREIKETPSSFETQYPYRLIECNTVMCVYNYESGSDKVFAVFCGHPTHGSSCMTVPYHINNSSWFLEKYGDALMTIDAARDIKW